MRCLPLLLLAVGCGNDIAIAKQSICDGVKQGDEETVDAPFDADQDGAFDAGNPNCAEVYGAPFLDCDDANPDIRPGAPEVECNGVDDDCTADTPDGEDIDADGYDACEDCADSVPEVNPGALETACNDVDDDCDESTPDGEDADGDGATACTDCDDGDADVGPGLVEATCNGIDDDCDDATPDGADLDADGWTQCDDCDDLDGVAYPGATEVCDNGADDDCNGDIDDGCVSDYSDTWDLDANLSYTCAWGNVTIDFDRVLIDDASPDITINALGGGIQPGEMTGTFTSSTDFEAENYLRGSCNERYTITGTFTSLTSFEATITAEYSGSFCLDCTNQSWSVVGSR